MSMSFDIQPDMNALQGSYDSVEAFANPAPAEGKTGLSGSVEITKIHTGGRVLADGMDTFLKGISRIASVALAALAKVAVSLSALFTRKTAENAAPAPISKEKVEMISLNIDSRVEENPLVSNQYDAFVHVQDQEQVAEPVAVQPAVNSYRRVAKCAAMVGLGAAAVYGATYLPVVGPVLCGIPSNLASLMPNLSSLNPVEELVCSLEEGASQVASTVAAEPCSPMCSLFETEAPLSYPHPATAYGTAFREFVRMLAGM